MHGYNIRRFAKRIDIDAFHIRNGCPFTDYYATAESLGDHCHLPSDIACTDNAPDLAEQFVIYGDKPIRNAAFGISAAFDIFVILRNFTGQRQHRRNGNLCHAVC